MNKTFEKTTVNNWKSTSLPPLKLKTQSEFPKLNLTRVPKFKPSKRFQKFVSAREVQIPERTNKIVLEPLRETKGSTTWFQQLLSWKSIYEDQTEYKQILKEVEVHNYILAKKKIK
mmetsp:Transcript_10622/g.15916  ORF Transcript_10622/g.15916 Transcript_10622/m.15916 type:complete len:116 (-) Transcript_10622:410-757(-)